MGNAASQEQDVVEPPPEWDPISNGERFQLVSPMSDLSDPSMFLHRKPHPKSDTTVGQIAGKNGGLMKETAGAKGNHPRNGSGAIRQTPAADRRRKSKVIATRDSAYKHESRPRELAPPSAFYFPEVPTKESEENLNRFSSSTGRRVGRPSHGSSSNNRRKSEEADSMKGKENKKKNKKAPLFQKARRNVNKAKTCLTGCFEESGHKIQLMKDHAKQRSQRGEKLESEVGSTSKIVASVKENSDKKVIMEERRPKEEKHFDPYNEKGRPVMQFIDGVEKELKFNPVWRESHHGTYYHDASTTTGTNRKSDPSNATTWKRESGPSCFEIQSTVNETEEVVNPSHESQELSLSAPSIYEDLEAEKENQIQQVPRAPGELTEEQKPSKVANLISKYDHYCSSTESRQSAEKKSVSVEDITNSESSGNRKRVSLSSLATSHESTYWNCYYKEQVQVLHHEDAYFDRLAYASKSENTLPEPSPIASQSVVTPVANLFDRGEPETKLLGMMDRSDVTNDSQTQDSDIVSVPTEIASKVVETETESDVNKIIVSEQEIEDKYAHLVPDDNEEEDTEEDMPMDEKSYMSNATSSVLSRSGSTVPPKPTEKAEEQTQAGTLPRTRRSGPVDLDITPMSSHVGSAVHSLKPSPEEMELSIESSRVSVSSKASNDHPSDESEESSKTTALEDLNGTFEVSSQSKAQMAKLSLDVDQSRENLLDKRLSANQVLVQTKLLKNITASSKRSDCASDIALKKSVEETPERAMIKPAGSFGSAYSYKDKDVFTPVTASMTYPKGSPFRPRLDVPGKTMAKASLEQPIMFTQSMDNMSRRSSSGMEIQATESAPSILESHDYRDIAMGCYLEDTPSTKKEQALASYSPGLISVDSPASVAMSPGQPLLSEQAMTNAAFLFSPSYAGSKSLLTDGNGSNKDNAEPPKRIEQRRRDSTFTISTLGSRSRTSIVSARSRNVTIPVSVQSLPSKKNSCRSSVADVTSQKSVRFSTDGAETSASRYSSKSVKFDFGFSKAPETVDIPGIETKVSDLSDAVSSMACGESMEDNCKQGSLLGPMKAEDIQGTIKEEPELIVTSEQDAASLLESPEKNADTLTDEEMEGPTPSSPIGADTPEKIAGTWTYNKFSRGVTPMVGKDLAQSKISNSPVIRFKAAKNKFGKPESEKILPVKKASPRPYKIRRGNGLVGSLAQKFDKGPALVPKDIVSTTTRSFSSAASSASGASSGTTNRPLLRTPQILGYKPKTHPNIFQTSSCDSSGTAEEKSVASSIHKRTSLESRKEIESTCTATDPIEKDIAVESNSSTVAFAPTSLAVQEAVQEETFEEMRDEEDEEYSDDEESLNSNESNEESTFIAASVATLRQEDRFTTPSNVVKDDESYADQDEIDMVLDNVSDSQSIRSHPDVAEEDNGSVLEDEAEDDFAELLLENTTDNEEETVATVQQKKSQIHSIRSVFPDDDEEEEDSTFTNLMMARTYSEDESTTMSSLLAQQIEPKLRTGAAVKPEEQKIHRPVAPPGSLHLSPLQRTPMQSRKWRELAASAQKQDSKKWGKGKKIAKNKQGSKGSIFRRSAGLSERNTNVLGND